jgi:hypothetical protein
LDTVDFDTGAGTVSGRAGGHVDVTEAKVTNNAAKEATGGLKTASASSNKSEMADQSLNATLRVAWSWNLATRCEERANLNWCFAVVLSTDLLETAKEGANSGGARDWHARINASICGEGSVELGSCASSKWDGSVKSSRNTRGQKTTK